MVELTRVVECGSPPEALWPILADTDRFNRAVGLAHIDVLPLEGAGAARYLISATLGGFRVEYEERPAVFVENERLSSSACSGAARCAPSNRGSSCGLAERAPTSCCPCASLPGGSCSR